LYGYETWSLTLREEHRLRVFENRVLRRMFGLKRDEVTEDWRKLHNEDAATIWWPRVKLKTSQAEFSNLQRMACLGITGAMRSAPTAAMEVLLGLPPLHLQLEAEAKVGNYRLRCNEQWRPESEGFGHEERTHPSDGV
jgi:hypothetical protein